MHKVVVVALVASNIFCLNLNAQENQYCPKVLSKVGDKLNFITSIKGGNSGSGKIISKVSKILLAKKAYTPKMLTVSGWFASSRDNPCVKLESDKFIYLPSKQISNNRRYVCMKLIYGDLNRDNFVDKGIKKNAFIYTIESKRVVYGKDGNKIFSSTSLEDYVEQNQFCGEVKKGVSFKPFEDMYSLYKKSGLMLENNSLKPNQYQLGEEILISKENLNTNFYVSKYNRNLKSKMFEWGNINYLDADPYMFNHFFKVVSRHKNQPQNNVALRNFASDLQKSNQLKKNVPSSSFEGNMEINIHNHEKAYLQRLKYLYPIVPIERNLITSKGHQTSLSLYPYDDYKIKYIQHVSKLLKVTPSKPFNKDIKNIKKFIQETYRSSLSTNLFIQNLSGDKKAAFKRLYNYEFRYNDQFLIVPALVNIINNKEIYKGYTIPAEKFSNALTVMKNHRHDVSKEKNSNLIRVVNHLNEKSHISNNSIKTFHKVNRSYYDHFYNMDKNEYLNISVSKTKGNTSSKAYKLFKQKKF